MTATQCARRVLLGCLLSAALVLANGCTAAKAPAPSAPSAESSSSASVTATGGATDSGAMPIAPTVIGQPTETGDWALTVTSVSFEQSAGGASAASGKQLAVVAFELVNNAPTGRGIGQTDFKLTGADGTEFQATPTTGADFIFNTPQPIKAGETRKIKIAYEVPSDLKEFKLTFTPFLESGPADPAVVEVK